MPADRQEIYADPPGIDGILPVRLDGVHMKQAGRLLLPDNRRSLLYGFHRSDLVIHMHHGDQDRVRPQRLPEFLQINHAPGDPPRAW